MLSIGNNADAQLLSQTTTNWSKLLDSPAPDMGIDMAETPDDCLVYLSIVGSADNYDPQFQIFYDNKAVATGAPYYNTDKITDKSYNNNLNLIKTDKDGQMKWMLYSTSGDVYSGNGGVISLSDGSIIATAIIRHTKNSGTTPITIIDATGKETKLDWTLENNDDNRFHKGLIIKTDANGALLWAKLIEASIAPQPGSDKQISNPIYFYGLERDRNDNFYISGRYCNPVSFLKADGTVLTLTPHNTVGWTGETQDRGDLFIAKFNEDGFLLDCMTTEGSAYAETTAIVSGYEDDLIVNFVAQGEGSISLGGQNITIGAENTVLVTVRMTTDFEVKWINTLYSELINGKKATFQNNVINVIGDELWICGMGNFNIPATISTNSDNPREGFLFHFDANSGKLLASTTSRKSFPNVTAITGFIGAFESNSDEDNNIYVYGYSWNGTGVFICSIDKTSLDGTEWCSLIKGGSMPTTQAMRVLDDKLYTITRGRDNNIEGQELQPINSDLILPTRDWAVCLASFKLPFSVAGETPLFGDLNKDSSVNVGDVGALYTAILNGASDTFFDLNDDGSVNAGDVGSLYQLILGGGGH